MVFILLPILYIFLLLRNSADLSLTNCMLVFLLAYVFCCTILFDWFSYLLFKTPRALQFFYWLLQRQVIKLVFKFYSLERCCVYLLLSRRRKLWTETALALGFSFFCALFPSFLFYKMQWMSIQICPDSHRCVCSGWCALRSCCK